MSIPVNRNYLCGEVIPYVLRERKRERPTKPHVVYSETRGERQSCRTRARKRTNGRSAPSESLSRGAPNVGNVYGSWCKFTNADTRIITR